MLFQEPRALPARRHPSGPAGSPRTAWRNWAKSALTAATPLALLATGSGTASAAEAHFVPEATKVAWDGVVATVSFREVDVPLSGKTTISTKLSVDIKVFCTQGESTIDLHASATGLTTSDHPIKDGTVAGVAKFPVQVKGTEAPGYTCVVRHREITAVLEDFRTGATLVHHA
ncbi:hypothetical protein [Amycolatopsis sp. GA6-003]|uniref:hypothetical protein n=1 Tax=Amycolatopsis sp. GA6-003 TaxID=2652444 RepID=UPI003916D479